MKIGIFDSGLGGLIMTHAIRNALPDHDLVYFGDTLHVPYGRRSKEAVYDLTRKAVQYLFEQEDCRIVILACNTASARALRQLQQTWLVKHYPARRILGVVVPTLEAALESGCTRIGLIGTESTVHSGVYEQELRKLNPAVEIFAQAAPLLVPLIEENALHHVPPILAEYLAPLKESGIQSLILGCTHYSKLSDMIAGQLGENVHLLSQSAIVPESLKDYLDRHPEIDRELSRNRQTRFLVTDLTTGYQKSAQDIYGERVDLESVTLA